jgi:hypothetical protein
MTLTNTVTSFAHDAAKSAGEIGAQLGSQAKELGKSAAEIGSDAATNVASAAQGLASTLAKKVPGVRPKRHVPWAWIAVGLAAIVGLAAARKSKGSSSTPSIDDGGRSVSADGSVATPVGAVVPVMN